MSGATEDPAADQDAREGICELCGRRLPLTRHHLIPRTRHRNRKTRKRFTGDALHQRILMACRPCHNQIHAILSEKQLADHYNTREALLEQPEIHRFAAWISTKPAGFKPKSRSWKKRP